jgi:hypothetical protein
MKAIEAIFLTRIKQVLTLSAMLIGASLICYGVFAQEGRGRFQRGSKNAASSVSPAAESPDCSVYCGSNFREGNDPEFNNKRRKWMQQFFSLGNVSPAAYAEALTVVRTLPTSALLQGQKFMSVQGPSMVSSWTSPIPPPIRDSSGCDATTRIQALGVDPTNNYIVYTGSFGGLAKSTDAGATWLYLSDTWASQAVSCITVDPNPSRHNHVFVGTGMDESPLGVQFAAGLYRSFDGGASWTNLGATEFGQTLIRAIAIDPRDSSGQTVYAANARSYNSGLWRSTDSGTTWTRLRQAGSPGSQSRYDGIHDLAMDPSTKPSTIYVTDDDGAFKSTHSGQWTSIRSLPDGGLSELRFVGSAIYLLDGTGAGRNLYKSTNAGGTWIQIQTQCPCPPDVCADPNPPDPPICADSCVNRCGNIGFDVFAVDPANPQTILGGNLAQCTGRTTRASPGPRSDTGGVILIRALPSIPTRGLSSFHQTILASSMRVMMVAS